MTRARGLGALAGAALVLAVAGAVWAARRDPGGASRAAVRPAAPRLLSPVAFQRRTGVRVLRVAVSGGGGLVDVRYQVLDAAAAAGLHDAPSPELVDERTGVVVRNLFMGHSHSGPLKTARTYFLLFENPATMVRRGTRVTVQLGAARLAHVRVE